MTSTRSTGSTTRNWRDVIKVHPAADLLPPMASDELAKFREDIKKNGLKVPIVLWAETQESEPFLLDGRNRLDAAALAEILNVRAENDGRQCAIPAVLRF